jgi:tRNA 2-thiouridine synthesizing protein A|nr:MAG: hypothetical protein KatS3mg041_1170 [Bacteroidota bacterium]
MYTIKQEVDARGMACPGPLMELVRMAKKAQPGDVIAVISSDPGSIKDIPAWAEKVGHRLLEVIELDNRARKFVIEIQARKPL